MLGLARLESKGHTGYLEISNNLSNIIDILAYIIDESTSHKVAPLTNGIRINIILDKLNIDSDGFLIADEYSDSIIDDLVSSIHRISDLFDFKVLVSWRFESIIVLNGKAALSIRITV